ncbi:MAG: gliding motility-associated C-terminal domain-containing protein [Brumimicrobium sp.]|nr:gliding motility-associated C-terminal domain-containing protein [Brumimicrobium sp.]
MKRLVYKLFIALLSVFVFSVNSFAQPSNDNCSYAQTLSVNPYNGCVNTSGNTTGASQNIPGCVGNADDDVWYQFTATSTSQQIKVVGSAGFDAVLQVFSGSCSTLASMGCVDNTMSGGTEIYNGTNFVVGQVYRVRVYHYLAGSGSGTFTICVTQAPTAPANDICGNAINLNVNTSCSYSTFNNDWATQSYPGCAGTADDDVWFKFTATNSVQTITVDPSGVGTGLMDPVVELFSGSCTTLNTIICSDNGWFGDQEVINAVGLIPGQVYYIRVYDYYTNWTDAFRICITGAASPAPTNDEPCNAISLPTVTSACNYSRFTNVGATQTPVGNAPTPTHTPTDPGCETGSTTGYTTNAGDVWFKVVVPPSGTIHVTMEPNIGTGAATDGVMALYTGTCSSLTQIAYSNDHSCYPTSLASPNSKLMPFITKSGLTPGSTVYIRFWNWGSSSKGQFGLCVTDATNDNCSDALYICDINGYKGTTGAYYTADRPGNMRGNCETNNPPTYTYTPGVDQGGIFGLWTNPLYKSPNLDVQIDNNSWIRFTAAATTAVLNVNIGDCYRGKGIQMQVFAANNCASFTPVSEFKESASQFTLTANGLTVGNDYILMIDGFAGDICNYTISANSGVQFPSINPVSPICQGGSVVLTAPPGATSYEWQHSGETTQSVTVTPSSTTTYTCVVTGLCDHKQSLTVQVVVKQKPSITLSTGNNTAICTGQSVTITASGATSYTWSGGLGSNPSVTVTPASNQTYTVTGSQNGCTNTASVNVTVNAKPTVNIGTKADVTCNGANNGTATATASGNGPFSYTWSPSGGNGAIASGLAPGTYTVSVTDGNGCINTSSVVISQPTVLAVTTSATQSSCTSNTGTVTANPSGGNGGYTYSWNPSGQTTQTATNLGANTYTVTVTDSKGCTKTATANVSNLASPSITLNNLQNVNCAGNSTGSIAVNASGGSGSYTYQWTPNVGSGASVTSLAAGSYTVKVTDGAGCSSLETYTVTELNPTPTVAPTADAITLCAGSNIQLHANAIDGGTNPIYTWNGPNGFNSTSANPNVSNAGTAASGIYTVTVTGAGSCPSAQGSVNVTVNALPSVSLSSKTDVLCNGYNNGAASVSASGSGPFSYSWSPSGGNAATASNLGPNSYTVTVTDANMCQNTQSVVITEPAAIVLTPSSTNSDCSANNGTASVGVTGGNGGYSYQWDDSNGQSGSTAISLGAGTYHVSVTDIKGCSESATVVVSNPAAPSATINGVTDVTCENGTDGSANVSASGGSGNYTYAWTPSGGTNATATNLTAGSYTVVVTDDAGCSISQSVTITFINAAPEVIGSALQNGVCEWDVIQLNASTTNGGTTTTYSWSGPNGYTSTSQNPTITSATQNNEGVYTVVATTDQGCISAADTVGIVINPTPFIISPQDAALCEGEDITIVLGMNNVGNNPSYQWTGPNGFTSTEQNPSVINAQSINDGMYNVTVTTEDGCIGNGSLAIFVNPLPIVDSTYSQESYCSGTPVLLSISNPNALNYTWYYDNEVVGQGTTYQIDKGTTNHTGTYYVYAENGFGCSALAATIDLTIKVCDIIIVESFSPNGDGVNEFFHIENLEAYPNTEVWIYTRWGLQVYHDEDYQNDWDGTSQSNLNVGKEALPEGTYYYLVKLGGEKETPKAGELFKGFVYIKR